MTLHGKIQVRVDDFQLALELHAPAGAVTAVLGPNGAGKTTLLRCIAGTLAIDAGRIALDGSTLDEPPATFVSPERRRLGIVFQDYVLFPHLSALDNVAFGPRSTGRSTRDARRVAHRWLEHVGVADRAGAKPSALSGGESQRVALARALATEPAALLLDEPLAALDAGTRVATRRDLRRYLDGFAGVTLLVTHDPLDALALADHVAIVEHGRLSQAGRIGEVATKPRSRYVADLIGTNLLRGRADGAVVSADDTVLTIAEPRSGPVFVTIAPTAIALHRHPPEGSPRNVWHTGVTHLDQLGDRVRVHLAPPLGLVAEITPAAATELELREGASIWASVKATEIAAYPQ